MDRKKRHIWVSRTVIFGNDPFFFRVMETPGIIFSRGCFPILSKHRSFRSPIAVFLEVCLRSRKIRISGFSEWGRYTPTPYSKYPLYLGYLWTTWFFKVGTSLLVEGRHHTPKQKVLCGRCTPNSKYSLFLGYVLDNLVFRGKYLLFD